MRCWRIWAAMELPYTSLNSSFMVEGFMRNCRDSCSMVMRLSRCSVREPMDLPDDLQLLRRTATAVVVLIQRWQMGRTGHQLAVRLGTRHLHRALDDLVQQLGHLRIRRPVVDLPSPPGG